MSAPPSPQSSTRGRRHHRRGRHRQRQLRHPHHPLRDRPPGPAGRRLRRGLPRRRHHAAVGHHGRRKQPKEQLRLLPADGRRRGADVRRRAHPRLVLPPRGPPVRGRDPHLPPDRPPAAPVLRQGPAQRGPGRRSRHGAQPRPPVRRRRDQRRLGVHPAGRPAVLRPDRRHPRRADQRPVGRLPDPHRARGRRLRHGRGRPRPGGRRRRDHDGRGRGHREDHRAGRRRRDGPDRGGRGRRASRPPSRSSRRCARRRPSSAEQGRQGDRRVPALPRLPGRRLRRRRGAGRRRAGPGAADRRQAGARGRDRRASRTRPRQRWPASSRAARRRSPPPSAR